MLLNELYEALAKSKKKPKAKAKKKILPKRKVHIKHHVKVIKKPTKITKSD